jgi:hypothetical protein
VPTTAATTKTIAAETITAAVEFSQADDVGDVAREERDEPGQEQVARKHEEHVAGQRQEERHDEPAAPPSDDRMEAQGDDHERDHGGGLAHVLERLVAAPHRNPVAHAEAGRDRQRCPGGRRHAGSF